VTYNRHPLYTNTTDTAPGQAYGQGCPGATGGVWWVLSKRGTPTSAGIGTCQLY
jgi:hypothetical protein